MKNTGNRSKIYKDYAWIESDYMNDNMKKEWIDRLAGLLPQEAQMEGPVVMEGTLD
ncbi:hypothetical protein DEGADCKI_02281 [[Clostridium] scindens]|nr:hypothetical protein DEGADCKI_02281 [[Clostridium] scindens]